MTHVASAPSFPMALAVWLAAACMPIAAAAAPRAQGLAAPLSLRSSAALVLDEATREVLLSKNSLAVLPIASLTKLMTALVVLEAAQPTDELLSVTDEDVDTEKHSRSRLAVGVQLTRSEMLHLALMASANRAAHALARHYPGGAAACVEAMNRKAAALQMFDTRFTEPTGLSSRNQSSAQNLALLVMAANEQPVIRELSTSPELDVAVGRGTLRFQSTNRLLRNRLWDISLQKTGYITEAGRCLVMRVQMAGRQLVMVLLDAAGRRASTDDSERVRRWVTQDLAQRPGAGPSAGKTIAEAKSAS
jgi:serine-type D-Ala-D-Ala endopeptidase (penicillin-binding protein 7)